MLLSLENDFYLLICLQLAPPCRPFEDFHFHPLVRDAHPPPEVTA